MAIRYDADLNADLRRTVANYNSKIKRLQSKGYSKSLLPRKVTVADLKAEFTNRRALKREIDLMTKFGKRGAESLVTNKAGATMTQYDYNRLRANRRVALRSINRRYKEASTTEPEDKRFRSDWFKQIEAKQESIQNFDIEHMSQEEIRRRTKDIEKEINYTQRSEKFYQSYFEMLGIIERADVKDASYIKSRLMELTPRQLATAFNQYRELSAVEERYKTYKRTLEEGKRLTPEEQMYADMADDDMFVPYVKSGTEDPIGDLMERDEQGRTAIDVIVESVKNNL